MELAPGSHWQSEPHLRGTSEFVTLFAGAIEITADQKDIVVQAGESVRFQGDTTHAYRNISDQTTLYQFYLKTPKTETCPDRLHCRGSRLFFQSSNSVSCLRIAPVAALIS